MVRVYVISKMLKRNLTKGYKRRNVKSQLGSYAAQWAVDRIGSWWKRARSLRASQKAKRRAGSETVTARARKGLVRQEGSSVSASTCNFGKRDRFSNKLQKASAPQYLSTNDAGQNYQSSVGKQFIFQYPWLSYTDLHAMYVTAPGTPTVTSRFIVEKLYSEMLIANAASYNTNITIYDIMCRRDTPVSGFDPVTCMVNGISDEGQANGYQDIGATPFQSEQLNQFFKVVQTTRVDLPSGGTHRHTVAFEPNRLVHAEVIASLSANANGSLKDLGCFTLIVFHGQPAHDQTTTTSVTISAASLDVCVKRSYSYRFIDQSSANYHHSENLATSFAVGAQFVNDLVGQVQDAAGLHPGTLLS